MSLYTKLIRYLILCLFCFSGFFPIKVHPQQNAEDTKYLYDQGKKVFEGLTGFGGAKGQLDFANKRLSEILTLEDIQNILGRGELPLSVFFMKLVAAHGQQQVGDIINTIEGTYSQSAKDLKEAMDNFKKAGELDPDYTDAHLKLADVYLTMNNQQKAVEAYDSCLTLGFKGMTLSLGNLRDLTRRIAKVYPKDETRQSVSAEVPPSESNNEPGVTLIRNYMSFAEGYLKQNPNEASAIVNKFELVQFYIDTSRPTDARREYEKIYSQVEADLQKELDARNQVRSLNSQITNMKGSVASVTFSFSTKWKASSLESMEALLNLIPVLETMVVGEELAKYYIVSILPTGMSIKFANEMVINNERKEVSRIIPAGDYISIVTLSQPNIKNKTEPRFRVILSWDRDSANPELEMHTIVSKDDKSTMKSVTYELPPLDYIFRIEPPPPPPSFWRKAALLALLACAAGVSVVAY